MEKCAILIFTCSNFSDLWSNNLALLDKHWKEHPKYFLCSDGPSKYGDNFDNTLIFSKDMSTRIIESLEYCLDKYEYVLFTLDDYFICNKINNNLFNQMIETMDNDKLDYIRLFKNPKAKGEVFSIKNTRKILLKNVYDINFYPGIWKTSSLLSILRKNEDIWKCEARLTRRFREKEFNGIAFNSNKVFPIVDVVRKGKYLRSAYRYLKKEKLFISDRPVRTVKETFKLWVQTTVSNCSPKFLKEKLKKHFRKKGKIFYSDYADTED